MSLFIHNTLTNKKEEFVPIEKGKVKMYVCGVTVYDDIHMGHARSMIVFDMVAKYLRYSGYEVTHVTNFTDVDDKIIIKANKEGIDALELSRRYIDKYFEDIKMLGIGKADIYPKASESMDDIISMCQKIIDNGYGYVTPDGSVYFSVEKAKSFGCLTNKKLEDMESTGRIAQDEQKRNPLDFAVWKAAKPGEIAWDSPWGKGRPGWHIECSAMIAHHLGEKIDIHGGGNDLIFPHHENEILQTEAVTGGQLANYWMHNGMLVVKGHGMTKEEKMSKSLGNFFTVRDVAQKYDSHIIRFLFLNTHYMSPLIYGEEGFELASASLKRIWNNYRELQAYIRDAKGNDDAVDLIKATKEDFIKAMDDDFNTPEAIKVFFNVATASNKMIADKTLSKKGAEDIIAMLKGFDSIFGILPDDEKSDDSMEAVMAILMDVRSELRKRKAYDLADMIRDRLTEAGIQLEDSSDGMKWKKI
ncbi:MAG: cysteine--tRNA ligase [Candidatus Methanomethylophilaceae archaeon]|nr:cysteine--tRNA ligase [Candidatus Methanomethylophilaceae archaeon]